ncbi:MAG: sigma-54 factor interaction domain-containing protein [Sandaracinaceae bacterium]|nr:sigma-54 factor interaction domain-containing protein [Sandaracinaceae bacterium]MDW8247652.1 sigma 54-interacting transcriptional regulator [Sandaracinaceae bacterium]
MRRNRAMIERIAAHETIGLIRGESGGRKELVAEALHHASPRAAKPLIKLNLRCPRRNFAFERTFGHKRGAFTGEQPAAKKGVLSSPMAKRSSQIKVEDISPQTQTALLRVPEERSFELVGGTQTFDHFGPITTSSACSEKAAFARTCTTASVALLSECLHSKSAFPKFL